MSEACSGVWDSPLPSAAVGHSALVGTGGRWFLGGGVNHALPLVLT